MITAVFAIGSVIYALIQPEIYRSEALLAPAESRQPSNPLFAQLGMAAGIVGVSVGNETGNQVSTAIATIQSRDFITRFVEKHELRVTLMAGAWDRVDNDGNVDPSIYDLGSASWRVDPPTDEDVYHIFRAILQVSENQNNGLVTVAIEWHNPVEARDWVNWLVADINELIKEKELQEATSAIEYLQNQLQSTQLVEMQRAFYQLIESQTRIVMLADVREDYVFRTIDPAYIPQTRIKPRRGTIVMVFSLIGLALASILVIIRHNLNREA